MPREGTVSAIQPLNLLTESQVEQVHKATLEVLQDTGVQMENSEALAFLAKNGCRVDHDIRRVRIPPELAEKCIESTPEAFTARAPDPENDLQMGGKRLYFTHTSGMQTIDLESFEPRDPSRKEYVEAVRILDSLQTIDQLGCYPYFGFEGIASEMAIIEGVALHLKHCGKHQAAACSNDCEIFTLRMAEVAGCEFSATIGSSAPLTWSDKALSAAFRIVDSGHPLSTVDGSMMGGSGPATPVGSVILSNAEHIAMIVLCQLLNPGQRIVIGHFSAPLNMKTGSPAFGQIGASISNVIFNQIWRHYRVPISNGSPGYVNAKMIDYQAGYEKGIAGLLSALAGVNMMLLHFGVSSEVSAHPLQAVLDDDIARMISFFLKGEEISEESLATEVIKKVGPIPGHFLSQAHTRKWFRKEQCVPRSADKLTYPEWIEKEKPVALDYARARMEELLAAEEKTYISESQEREIEKIIQEAREYYRNR